MSGSNSVLMQSGNNGRNIQAGDNSTIVQAGDNSPITVNSAPHDVATKQDITDLRKDLEKMLNAKAIESNESLAKKYRFGFILFGVADGHFIYVPKLKSIQVNADWDNASLRLDRQRKIAQVVIPDLRVVYRGLDLKTKIATDSFPLVENLPTRSHIVSFGPDSPNIFYEVLDSMKEIFVIGFK